MNNNNYNNSFYTNNQSNQSVNNNQQQQYSIPVQQQNSHINTNMINNNIPFNNQAANYYQPNVNNQQYTNYQPQQAKQQYQSNIENFTLSRLLIKKVHRNKEKNNTSLLIQLSRNEGFFIDSKFVKVDNYTLNFTIGIIPTHNYSVLVIGNKQAPARVISGTQLIELIKNNINTDII